LTRKGPQMAPKGRNNPNNVNKIIFTVGFISLLFGEKLEI